MQDKNSPDLSLKFNECNTGEFTLVFNDGDIAHPAGLTRTQHDLLQVFIQSLGYVSIVKNRIVKYELTPPQG